MTDRFVSPTTVFRSTMGSIPTSIGALPVLTLVSGRAQFETSGVVGAYLDVDTGRADVSDAPGVPPVVIAVAAHAASYA